MAETFQKRIKIQRNGKYLAYKQSNIFNDDGTQKNIHEDDGVRITKEKYQKQEYIPLDKTDYMPMDDKHLETVQERRMRKQHHRLRFQSRFRGPISFKNPNRYVELTEAPIS